MVSKTDTKLHYLEARTNQLTDQMAQLTLNNQKEHGHPRRGTRVWVRQQRRMGLAPGAGAEVQAPPAEVNNPIMFSLGVSPPHGGTSRLLMLEPRRFLLKLK